jgi:peroxiredoxin
MRSRFLVRVASVVLIGAALSLPAWATDNPPPPRTQSNPNSTTVGPSNKQPILGDLAPGERAPDFWLDGSNGDRVKLSSLRGHWIVLVFNERYRTLAHLDTLDDSVRTLGARVVGVCHEKQQTLTTAVARKEFDMLMLADATGEVSAMYGLFDWQHTSTESGFFVLDRDGIVRLAMFGRLFPPEQMLGLLQFVTETPEAAVPEKHGP